MKKLRYTVLSIILALTIHCSCAQNLVPNGSFEAYDTCPSNINGGLIRYADFWINPTDATPDYFNACDVSGAYSVPTSVSAGYQNAYQGVAYIGIVQYAETPFVNSREYAQIQLTSSLAADSCYYLRFYVSIGNYADNYQTTNFDAYFSATAVSASNMNVLPYSPQFVFSDPSGLADTIGWHLIEGIFQAQGGEAYMTIGNFHDDTNTTWIIYDTAPTNPGFAYYLVDSISLEKVTCPIDIGVEENENVKPFKLFPNPNNGNMSFRYQLKANDKAEIQICDIAGKLINSYQLNSTTTQTEIDAEQLNSGIYFYTISVNNQLVQSDKLIIIK